MTPMKEDYLKIIFELGGTSKLVSNKNLAMSLGVAAGSVTEMVNKMADEKLVTHEPYSGIRLTNKGKKLAEELVRKHRIWETFLNQKLHFGIADVHDEAEKLEHVTSDEMIDRLDDFLDNPTHCPHGGVIPTRDGHYASESYTPLNEAKTGSTVIIERFIDNHDLLVHLTKVQIDLGDKIKVVSRDGFDNSLTVDNLTDKINGIVIGEKTANNVFVNIFK